MLSEWICVRIEGKRKTSFRFIFIWFFYFEFYLFVENNWKMIIFQGFYSTWSIELNSFSSIYKIKNHRVNGCRRNSFENHTIDERSKKWIGIYRSLICFCISIFFIFFVSMWMKGNKLFYSIRIKINSTATRHTELRI